MTFGKANILLPKDTDMAKWGTVACDQYTSEPEYWNEVKNYVNEAPSAFNLILPEVYLEDDDVDERIKKLNDNMRTYLEDGIFTEYKNCYIYVERKLKNGALRKGIVGAIDLEDYEYTKGSTTKVRATEKTVVERIPPRLKVRENAPLELPHIMILIDDPSCKIIESLGDKKDKYTKVYEFDLMQNSGSITGYKLDSETSSEFESMLYALDDIDNFNKRHSLFEKTPLVYAMGDGNHSLATAKEYYRKVKSGEIEGDASLARYALCELVNLHDSSLEFEAIHRVIFDVDKDDFLSKLSAFASKGNGAQSFVVVNNGQREVYNVDNPTANITVGSVQNFLDDYLNANKGRIDYIHGEDVVEELSVGNSFGIIFDSMNKEDLFKTVAVDGALPRKTFSMGEACDKRFYVEARRIK